MATKEQQKGNAVNLMLESLSPGAVPVAQLERAYSGGGRQVNSGSPLLSLVKFLLLAFILSAAIYMGIKWQSTPANLRPSVPPGSIHAN